MQHLTLVLMAVALVTVILCRVIPTKKLPAGWQPWIVMVAAGMLATLEALAEGLQGDALILRIATGFGLSGQMAIGLWHTAKRTPAISRLTGAAALLLFGQWSCSPSQLQQVCPIGASPVEQARTVATVAQLVCTGRPCHDQAETFAEIVRKADATREQVCEQWPTVEALALLVNDPRLTAAVSTATKGLHCEG